MAIKFYGTQGPNGYLSNLLPRIFTIQKIPYASNEHFYQSMKSADPETQFRIRAAATAAQAKRWGSQIKVRADWSELVGTPALRALYQDAKGEILERTKDHYMFMGLTQKFTQLRDLRARLLDTGDEELVHNSPKDPYWGCGKDGTGLNKQGRMLMVIRGHERTKE